MAYLRVGSAAFCLWICVAVVVTSRVSGNVTPRAPSTAAPLCAEDKMLQELQRIHQRLDSMQQGVTQPSISTLGSGSSMEFILNKFLAFESEQQSTQTQLKATQVQLTATQARLEAAESALQGKTEIGSTFVRWGRKVCTNSSQLVYSGVAGGSLYIHQGGAVDLLCLTLTPQFEETSKPAHAYIYGAEYKTMTNLMNHDVPCSVCRAVQSSTIMVPGTHACPLGWTSQYAGHLVAGSAGSKAATQYNCLDGEPQSAHKGYENKDGYRLYYVGYSCGSLPCPPYVHGKTALCVVCSK